MAIVAIIHRTLALRIAGSATIRIVLRIATIVATAIRQTSHARAGSAIAQPERIVAIIAAVAAMVDVRLQVGTAIEAGLLTGRTNALACLASAADAITSAHAAIVWIGPDVCARIAARDFTGRTGALTIRARRTGRTEEAAGAAILFIRAELDAADVRAAIDGSGRAHTRARDARTIGPALVPAHAAIVHIGLQVGAGILGIACRLSRRTSRTSARHAHLSIETIIAALSAIVQIFRQIRATIGTRHFAGGTRASACHTRRTCKAIFAAHAAIVVIVRQIDARIAAIHRSLRTRAHA